MKNTYILLRDKTESTSLSLEELQAMGLRPTDRIWIECQSVDWRSPLEIKELKNLVSAAKPVEQPKETDASVDQATGVAQSTVAKKRKQLLAGITVTNQAGLRKKPKTGITRTKEKLKQSENNNVPAYAAPVEHKEEEFTTSSVFASTASDIPVAKTGEQKDRSSFRLSTTVKKMALYAGLITTGALLMWLIQPVKTKPETGVQPSARDTENRTALPLVHSEDSIPIQQTDKAANSALENGTDFLVNAPKEPGNNTKEKPIASSGKTIPQELSNRSPEKNTKPAAEKKEAAVTAESITAQLALKANNYKVGAFGGIRDLTMTLQNNSPYLVENVTVELSYLNPEGKTIKTDQLYFQYVKPGEAPSLDVYKYKRGVKVAYRIIDIESKAITGVSSGSSDEENVSRN